MKLVSLNLNSNKNAKSSLICQICSKSDNAPINILCSGCGRSLLAANWIHVFSLVVSLCIVGYHIAGNNNGWFPPTYSLALIFMYIIIILRRNYMALTKFIAFFLFVAPLVFFLRFQYIQDIWLTIFVALMGLIIILYLSVAYLISWLTACKEATLAYTKGVIVISLMLFLVSLIVPTILSKIYPILQTYNSLLDSYNYHVLPYSRLASITRLLREILLVITAIQIMFFALVHAVKRKINPPKPLFDPYTKIPRANIPASNDIIIQLKKFIIIMINVSAATIETFLYFFEIIINVFKYVTELAAKFLWNYISEIFILTRIEITVFINTLFKFLKDHFLIILLCTLIINHVINIYSDFNMFIFNGIFSRHIIINVVAIMIEMIVFIKLITRISLAQVADSITKSNVLFLCTILISLLISSWILWILAHFVQLSPFDNIGVFTKYGSLFLVATTLALVIYTGIKKKLFK